MKRHVLQVFKKYNETQLTLGLFVLSILVKGLGTLFLLKTRGLSLIADAADYIQYAEYMLEQGPFVWDQTGLEAHAGPGFPLLLYLNFLLVGKGSFWFFLVVNTLFNALSSVVLFLLGVRLFKNKTIAVCASIWAIFYVQQLWFAPLILKESIVFLFFPLSILLLLRFMDREKIDFGSLIFFLLSYGYLIHTDERYFFYFPFLLLYLIFSGVTQKWAKGGALVTGLLLVMTPWLIRNYKVFDRPVVLTERTTKFTDKVFGYNKPLPETRKVKVIPTSENIKLYEAFTDSIQKGLTIKTNDVKYLTGIAKGVKEGQIPYSYSFLQRKGSYFIEFWRPFRFKGGFYGSGFRYMDPWSSLLNVTSIVQYGLLLPFFLLGLWWIYKNNNRGGWILLGLVFLQCVIHIFLAHAISRYRYPIDGFIFLIAFYGVAHLFHKKQLKYA